MAVKMLTTKELAKRLNVKECTCEAWRVRGGGPVFCKFGKAVRYPENKVEEFEQSSMRSSTSCAGA